MHVALPHLARTLPRAAALGLLPLLFAGPPTRAPDAAPARSLAEIHRGLGRGVNLGNALEAPREGEWGVVLREEYFDAIRRAGFDSVRIPIRWSAHAAKEPPYALDPEFARRVDWAVDQALSRGLTAVINVHHYDEMYRDPEAHRPRLVALWRQIAERYRSRPDRLLFELLNEPNSALTDERWNRIVPELLRVIRATNPQRAVIVGPGQWNHVERLPRLELPAEDRRLIATFHYYLPFPFTHQGAEWVQGSDRWLGTRWTGSPQELEALRRDFDGAAAWARRENRPVYLGEFGAYSRADMESRVRWTRAVAREAERRGFAWAYWEFCAGFGVYDPQARSWREPLRQALLEKPGEP